MSRTARAAAAVVGPVVLVALGLAGCSGQDADGPEPAEGTDTVEDTRSAEPSPVGTPTALPTQAGSGAKACLLAGTGGFDEVVTSEAAAGLERAASELGVRTATAELDAGGDPAEELDSLVERGCDVVTTVSYRLGDATLDAARRHPETDFVIVDFSYDRPPENLRGLRFDTTAPSFLAGYLAAGLSETGVVGTFGGAQFPGITMYLDGFHAGVERYNDDNDAQVQLLGWDRETQRGTFTNDLADPAEGEAVAAEMIGNGADILLPVADAAGLGALQAVREAGVRAIWSETDGCASTPRYCDVLVTSVVKDVGTAVFASIRDSLARSFDGRPYLGTLQNGGAGLVPYEQHRAVPADLVERLAELEQELVDGELEIE